MTSYPVSLVSIHDNNINGWNKVEQETHERRFAKKAMERMQGRSKKQKKVGARAKHKKVPGGRLRNWIGRRFEGQLNTYNRPMF